MSVNMGVGKLTNENICHQIVKILAHSIFWKKMHTQMKANV